MSTVRKTGPAPTISIVRRDDRVDAEVADVVHEERRDAVVALPAELRLARPVAAQPDLHVARGIDEPVAHEPVHRCAV